MITRSVGRDSKATKVTLTTTARKTKDVSWNVKNSKKICQVDSQLSLLSLRGRRIKYRPDGWGYGGRRSHASGGRWNCV